MRKSVFFAALAAMFLSVVPSSFAKTPDQGVLVIVFKDGHSQTFNLADIQRIEFPGEAGLAAGDTHLPPRGQFLGRWRVGDGNGNDFIITLKDDGNAERSLNDMHGTWVYVDGEAHVTWDDGSQDTIRKAGSKFEKCWHKAGTSFSDTPDNVTNAENLTPKPI
ncbi:MAG TPA: hypothetical protein VMD55_00945 [Terracidiphilus sp.]|nr:hypothetical protein [Terracidiphilus sp.]